MEPLTTFERSVLEKLLEGEHPVLDALRAQLPAAVVERREWTGVGFFTSLHVPDNAPRPPSAGNLHVGGVHGEIPGLAHGAGFVVFVNDGRMTCLEGFSYDEPWNEQPSEF